MSEDKHPAASTAAQTKTVDAEKIKHIAHLARIGISDEDAGRYALQMNSVLDYMKILEEVDTGKVEMTLQVNGLNNVSRPDEVRMEERPEDLLKVSPLPQIAGQIAVKAVIKEE
jgi:aspartyl-tRNA(Asn)/glutamyl-tRNA(Gln) amidotransferase subunit C